MSLPPFKIEDLKIIGYTAYICEECLVSHPLTLYWHSLSMKPVPTMHTCMNLAKDNTDAYFKMEAKSKTYYMYIEAS
jgi:hypothetical protein